MRKPRGSRATVFLNGKILTLSSARARASAVLVEDGRVSSIGSTSAVLHDAPKGVAKVDLAGNYVVPGFNDCHTHFIHMGVDYSTVDLSHTRSLEEALQLIRNRAKKLPEGKWLVATGWSESAWPSGRFIARSDLDKCCPGRPAVAYRICMHLCSVNSKAISELALDSSVEGAEVDAHGHLTGVLTEGAVDICHEATSPDSRARLAGLEAATRRAYELGVTSVTDNGSTADLATYMSAARSGRLRIRVCFNMPTNSLESLHSAAISTGLGDHWLRLGGLKVFCDGALGARSAALSRPYADDPRNKGMFVRSRSDFDEITSRANETGLQLAIHAIGDKGIEVAIKSIEAALRSHPRDDHRHRIEHLELPSRAHIKRMRKLGIIASMQPNFIGEWGGTKGMYCSRLGLERTKRNNPFREILDAGVRLVFGSDCMPFSPQYGLVSAANAPFPSQRITPLEAISAYTKDAACSTFEEDAKGTLEPGKLADFAVLSGDPTAPRGLASVSVLMTVLDGRIVYRAGAGNS